MVTKGFEGGLPERRAPIQESVWGRARRTLPELNMAFSPASQADHLQGPEMWLPPLGDLLSEERDHILIHISIYE